MRASQQACISDMGRMAWVASGWVLSLLIAGLRVGVGIDDPHLALKVPSEAPSTENRCK